MLGITAIDPVRSELLFERFVSAERGEPPDIDVDFEHDRREEVIQWIYDTYGHDRAALCAVVSRFRARGAVRDVGKALGLPEDVTAALARQVWGWSSEGVGEEQAAALNLNLADHRLRLTLDLARQLIGTPRHFGQHPGGFVLTLGRLDELVPIAPAAMPDRRIIEWDKDDIDCLKMMKVDVLGLGMLGCMRRAFDFLEAHKGVKIDLADMPAEDAATYAMIRRADTRRRALYEVRGLRDAPLPLFAAADARDGVVRPEAIEEIVPLVLMTAGAEVVEDYRSTQLSLGAHPLSFLRADLARQSVVPCASLLHTRDGRRVSVAGLVLVRQKPGSAKGVLFVTIEDETGIANLIVWPNVFERERRVITTAGMLIVIGTVQREGEVIHLIVGRVTDASDLLRSVGDRGEVVLPTGRGDEARHGGAPDPRGKGITQTRDIYIPDLRLGSGIKIPTRDFR